MQNNHRLFVIFEPATVKVAVVDNVVVGESGALRVAGGAGRELNVHGVVELYKAGTFFVSFRAVAVAHFVH